MYLHPKYHVGQYPVNAGSSPAAWFISGKEKCMCKYCDMESCSDSILSKKKMVLGAEVWFEVYISGKGDLRLCSEEEYGKPIASKKIKYCPMCGRKLEETNV